MKEVRLSQGWALAKPMLRYIVAVFIAISFQEACAQKMGVNETIQYINQKLQENPIPIPVNPQEYEASLYQITLKNGALTEKITIIKTLDSTFAGIDSFSVPFNLIGEISPPPTSYQASEGMITIFCNYIKNIEVRFDNRKFIHKNLYAAFEHLTALLHDADREQRDSITRLSNVHDPFAPKVGNAVRKESQEMPTLSIDNSNVIAMTKKNGIYEVPIVVNGSLKLNFILDSGASDISLPPDVVLTLIRTRTITKDDFIGSNTYRFADGTTAKSDIINLREIKIGSKTIPNVRGSISNSIDAPLLLGQSLLNRLGTVTLDYANGNLVIQQ